ncbi:hypothetical protein ALC56_04560, partial [Trachymyrmex septentrionalis]
HVVLGEKPPRDPFLPRHSSSEESRAGGGDPGKLGVKKSRLKASSPNRQGPQQCQMSEIDCHFIQIGSSATIALYSSRASFDKIFLRDAGASLEQAEQTRRHPDVTHERNTPPRIPRGATGCSREPSGDDQEPDTGFGTEMMVFLSRKKFHIYIFRKKRWYSFATLDSAFLVSPEICGKVFNNASALTKHKLTHSDERKYVCTMCGKAFKRQDHLNGHMLTHRNKKPYECKAEGCGKSYCDARSLRRHTENHHAGSKINDIIGPCSPTTGPHTPNTPGSNPSTPSTPGATSTTNGHGHAALKQLLSTEPAQTQQQKEGGRVVKPRLRIYDIELEVRRTIHEGKRIELVCSGKYTMLRHSVLLHHVHPFADRALQIKVSSEQDGDVSCTNVERDIGMREDVT